MHCANALIYSTYYMSLECDMVKYFKSRLIYFHEPKSSENKAWE